MECGIKEKSKPVCREELFKYRGKWYCKIHCRAKTDRGPCKRHHIAEGLRCDKHGGKSLKGLAHPGLTAQGKHSRYLGVMSPQMGEHYQRREQDLNKLSLDPEINLLHMRIEIMMLRMREGESGMGWVKALEAFEGFAEAQQKENREKALAALQKLGNILRRGVEVEKDWETIDELAYVKKPRLVEAEVKRQLAMAEIVHQKFVRQLFQVIAEGLKRRVKELSLPAEQAAAIVNGTQSDIRRVASGGNRGVLQLVSGRSTDD